MYSEVKPVEVANALTAKLSDSQKEYFSSIQWYLEKIDLHETNIKFDDDSFLLKNYLFVKLKANGHDKTKLTVRKARFCKTVEAGLVQVISNREEYAKFV